MESGMSRLRGIKREAKETEKSITILNEPRELFVEPVVYYHGQWHQYTPIVQGDVGGVRYLAEFGSGTRNDRHCCLDGYAEYV